MTIDRLKMIGILLLWIIGAWLLFLGYQKRENITNVQKEHMSITIIDLRDTDHPYKRYYVISGIMLLGLGAAGVLFVSRKRNQPVFTCPLETLTAQESKIVSLISDGSSNKEISDALYISPSTVKTHTNNLYRKLGVNNRNDLLILVKKQGFSTKIHP